MPSLMVPGRLFAALYDRMQADVEEEFGAELCTVPDPHGALREVARVLKPGGRLLFAEHVRSEHPRTAKVQDRIRPLWQVIGRGCQLNRDTQATIEASGLVIEEVQRHIVPKLPSFAHEAIVGSARKR